MPDIQYYVATEADYAAVRRTMAEVFEETAGQKATEFGAPLYDWQYVRNNSGSIVVLARDGDVVCGYYHVLLFPMRFRGKAAQGAVVQDVGTRREYRKHGIFRQMGGFALERMREAGVSFIYTFPNNLSLPSFVRNHAYTVVARAPVYLMPLATGPLMAKRLKLGAFGRMLGVVADPIYRMVMVKREALAAAESVQPVERFTDSITSLVHGFADMGPVAMDRTVSYLNWRFFAKPTLRYEAWILNRDGQPQAYTVTRRATLFDTECVLFMDFGCRAGEIAALRRLVSQRVEVERRAGAVLAVTMGLHPVFAHLQQLGFQKVPERFNPRTFNLLSKDLEEPGRPDLFQGSNWTITLADWDVF